MLGGKAPKMYLKEKSCITKTAIAKRIGITQKTKSL